MWINLSDAQLMDTLHVLLKTTKRLNKSLSIFFSLSIFKWAFSYEELKGKSYVREQGCLGSWGRRHCCAGASPGIHWSVVLRKTLGCEGKQEVGPTFQITQPLDLEKSVLPHAPLCTPNETDKMMGGRGWRESCRSICVHMELNGLVFSGLSFAIITAKRKITYFKIYQQQNACIHTRKSGQTQSRWFINPSFPLFGVIRSHY